MMLVVAAIVLVFYFIILLNTNSLMREVRSTFLGEVDPSETPNRGIHAYNLGRHVNHYDCYDVDLTVIRLFTFHNFHKGYVWVYYNYKVFDENRELISGSQNVFSKWRIQKEGETWEIIDIFERP